VLLEEKNAVIYGDGEKVGGVVAWVFACEGARVFLTGRTLESLDEVAEEIASSRTSNDGRDKKRRTYELEARIQRLLHRRHTVSKRVQRLGS
jgi:short-subunit dehydrogenase